jgi:hypothetical protein
MHAMKAYGVEEVQFDAFSISSLDGGELYAQAALTPGEEFPLPTEYKS